MPCRARTSSYPCPWGSFMEASLLAAQPQTPAASGGLHNTHSAWLHHTFVLRPLACVATRQPTLTPYQPGPVSRGGSERHLHGSTPLHVWHARECHRNMNATETTPSFCLPTKQEGTWTALPQRAKPGARAAPGRPRSRHRARGRCRPAGLEGCLLAAPAAQPEPQPGAALLNRPNR